MSRAVPVGGWAEQQKQLRSDREERQRQGIQTAYEAGQKLGRSGMVNPPPWMSHLHEIVPKGDPEYLHTFTQAHRYGRIEGYTDTEPDRIEDEVRPQAEKIVKRMATARSSLEGARTTYAARGLVALAGRSRYPITPTARRVHVAEQRVAGINAEAARLHDNMNAQLHAVENMRSQLAESEWQPPRKRES